MTIAFLLLVLSGVHWGAVPALGQSSCRPADSTSAAHLEYLKRLVSDAHPDYAGARSSTGLPAAPPSKVKLETRARVCRDGAEAMNAARQERGTVRQVWVFRLDSWYAVVDPGIQVGPNQVVPYYLFDRHFAYVRTLLIQ